MTTGEQGRTPPDAEHYLDLSGVEEDSPGPRFDVVLRGYDRRQVDEHVAGLRRINAQLRAQLAVRERRRGAAGAGSSGSSDASALEGRLSETIPEARRAPTPRPRGPQDEAGPDGPDMVGAFNDRLRGILQAAEQEAQLVRSKAAESLLAEHAESRAALAELRAQRDAVVDELVRLRGRLDEIISGPARPSTPPPGPPRPAGPWRGPGPGRPPGPRPYPGPRPPAGHVPGPHTGPPVPAAPGPAPDERSGVDRAGDDTVIVDATSEPDGTVDQGRQDGDERVDDGGGPAAATATGVDVTEGAHPSGAAGRAVPPERAADG